MGKIEDLSNEIYSLLYKGNSKEEICKKKGIEGKIYDKILSGILEEKNITEEQIKKDVENQINRIKSDFSYIKNKSEIDNKNISDNENNRKKLFELAKEMIEYKIPFKKEDVKIMQESIIYTDSLCTKDNLNIISSLIIKLGSIEDFEKWIKQLKIVHLESEYMNEILQFEDAFRKKYNISTKVESNQEETIEEKKELEESKNNKTEKEPSIDKKTKDTRKSRKNLYGYYEGTEKEIVYDCFKEVKESIHGDLIKKYYDEELNLIKKIEAKERDTMYGSVFPMLDRKIAKKINDKTLLKEEKNENLKESTFKEEQEENKEELKRENEESKKEIDEISSSSVIPVVKGDLPDFSEEEKIENRKELEKEAEEVEKIIAETRKENDDEKEDTDKQTEDIIQLENTSVSVTKREIISKESEEKIEVLQTSSLENPINIITNEEYIKTLELFNRPEFIELTKTKSIIEIIIISFKLGYVDGKYFSDEAIINFLGIDEEYTKLVIKNTLLEYKTKLISDIEESVNNIINMDTKKLSLENIRKEDKSKKEEN